MQAWVPPRLDPPAEIRLEDNLQREGLVASPASRPRDGVFSATVEVLGRLDDREDRLQAFRGWLHQDLQVAFKTPPPTLDRIQLTIFMLADPNDPMKAILDSVRFTRGWYQAPLQVEATERARVESLYR